MDVKELIHTLRDRIVAGGQASEEELYELTDLLGDDAAVRESLLDAAEAVTRARASRHFDSCSIVNARSGRCSENCKWCAQSAHYNTGCETYDIVDRDEALELARRNAGYGIGRFSFVASGKCTRGKALEGILAMMEEVRRRNPGLETCASLGLLGPDEMKALRRAGARRYHCNLETAPSMFPHLCTTHTIEDKLRTIAAAREAGLEICSGGIVGMGETRRQRMEFALFLREVNPVSIPLNVLCPIPGTPLGDMPLMEPEEILVTIALFRLAHPEVELRFAGGRGRITPEFQLRAFRIGVNGAIMGDMLTTVNTGVDQDLKLIREAGYEF